MKVENGHNVTVHYRGTLEDGTEFDNSRKRGKTLEFEIGSGRMLRRFESAFLGLEEGETKSFSIPSSEAYGPHFPEAIQSVPKQAFGEDFEFRIGGIIQGNGPQGPFIAKILETDDSEVLLDLNHPLAGKDLNFEIELVSNHGALQLANWNAKMKKAELLEVARSQGLKVNTRSTKAQIIQALQA